MQGLIPAQRTGDSVCAAEVGMIQWRSGAMPKGVAMGALEIRRDYTPSDLRRRAARERDRRAAMERQALHDAVQRFNAEGPERLHDKPRPGRPEQLSEGQQAALKAHILRGPRPERDGISAWRLVDLCEHVAHRYGVRYSLWGLSCLLKRLNLSRQKTRPSHPKGDPAAQTVFKKGTPSAAAGPRCRASRPAPSALVRG